MTHKANAASVHGRETKAGKDVLLDTTIARARRWTLRRFRDQLHEWLYRP